MTASESKGRFFYKTNRYESIRIMNRIESIRIVNWNALATAATFQCRVLTILQQVLKVIRQKTASPPLKCVPSRGVAAVKGAIQYSTAA